MLSHGLLLCSVARSLLSEEPAEPEEPIPVEPAFDDYGEAITASISGRRMWIRCGDQTLTTAVDAQGTQNGSYIGTGFTLRQPGLPTQTAKQSVAFNGTDAYVAVPHHDRDELAAGAICAWFRTASIGVDFGIAMKHNGASLAHNLGLWYQTSSNTLRAFLFNASAAQQSINVAGPLAPNTVYCVILDWGPLGLRLHLASGGLVQLRGTAAYTGGIVANQQDWSFGATKFASGAADDFIGGQLDEILLLDHQMSNAEIQIFSQATFPSTGVYELVVTGLSPAVYLKFAETTGTVFADSSGSGRSGSLGGTGVQLGVPSIAPNVASSNRAVDLGGTAWITVPHAPADVALTFPTNWEVQQSTDGFRFVADVHVSIYFRVNTMPAAGARAVIVSKSHTVTPGSAASYAETHPVLATAGSTVSGGSFEAYFDSNGAVHVECRSFRGRPCRVRTVNGLVTAGAAVRHLQVALTFDGVTAWLNGAKFEDGYANLLHVFGLAAEIQRVTWQNDYAWMIGRAAWGGPADITVDEFAIYLRPPSDDIIQTEVNSLAQIGSTPPALAHPIWGVRSQTVAVGGNIQSAVDNINAQDGGTVFVNSGTYNQSIILRSNVRLKVSSGTVTVNGTCEAIEPGLTTLTGGGDLFTGGKVLNINNSAPVGAVVILHTTLAFNRRWNPGSGSDDADGEMFIVEARTASQLTFEGAGAAMDFTAANRDGVRWFVPTVNIAIEGDFRFSDDVASGTRGVVAPRWSAGGRMIGFRSHNTGPPPGDGQMFNQRQTMYIQSRDLIMTGNPTDHNQHTSVKFGGAKHCVSKHCNGNGGKHGSDFDGTGSGGVGVPSMFNEVYDQHWVVVSTQGAGNNAAFRIHGSHAGPLNVRWRCTSDYGGPEVGGWLNEDRWHICGDTGSESGWIVNSDGADRDNLQDIHIIRPIGWFGTAGGVTRTNRCHFRNISRTANPTQNDRIHNNQTYGTGANVNTYANVDGPAPGGVWQQVS